MVTIEKIRLVKPLDNFNEEVAITSQIIAKKSNKYECILIPLNIEKILTFIQPKWKMNNSMRQIEIKILDGRLYQD